MAKERKKIQKATAIQYDATNHKAPIVIASGMGSQAEKILSLAKEHQIPLQEDAVLVEALMKLAIGEEIPVELYQVVAEVLVYVRKLNDQVTI